MISTKGIILGLFALGFMIVALGQNAVAAPIDDRTDPDPLLLEDCRRGFGRVSGWLKFYQHQGNYCPQNDYVDRDCTGAKYLQNQYHTIRPVQNVRVYVRQRSDNSVIGQGTTDSNGYFSIAWYVFANVCDDDEKDLEAQIIWKGEHKDGRFRLATPSGGSWIMWSNVDLEYFTTTSVGSRVWGNSSAKHALSNLYDGAHMMWANSLGQSNRMKAYFNNVQIRAWDSTTCGRSQACALPGEDKIIIGSSDEAYKPQATIMHEMGHVASYKASRDQEYAITACYCYGESGRDPCEEGCGWSSYTKEYASVQFEEAVATHLASIGLYFSSAIEPHYCSSLMYCSTDQYNIETSLGITCSSSRRPINIMRYLWDIYDSHTDYIGETMNKPMYDVVDTIHAFDNGTENRQKNEVWAASGKTHDDPDGRSAIDFLENWKRLGTSTSHQLTHNCGSAGD